MQLFGYKNSFQLFILAEIEGDACDVHILHLTCKGLYTRQDQLSQISAHLDGYGCFKCHSSLNKLGPLVADFKIPMSGPAGHPKVLLSQVWSQSDHSKCNFIGA